MPEPLPLDLRERIVAAYERGEMTRPGLWSRSGRPRVGEPARETVSGTGSVEPSPFEYCWSNLKALSRSSRRLRLPRSTTIAKGGGTRDPRALAAGSPMAAIRFNPSDRRCP